MTTGASRPRGLPLAAQIILLLVAVLVIGQAATLAVVVALPPPRPFVIRLDEVAGLLRSASEDPHPAPGLTVLTAATPPEADLDRRAVLVRRRLAQLAQATEAEVRFRQARPPLIAFPFNAAAFNARGRLRGRWGRDPFRRGETLRNGDRRRGDFRDPPPDPLGDPLRGPSRDPPREPLGDAAGAPPGERLIPHPGFPGDGPPAGREAGALGRPPSLERAAVIVGEFEAALRLADGRWRIVKTVGQGFPTDWQLRVMLWFAACLLVLAPAGYVFARRLTAPLRAFAKAAERLGRDPRAPPLAVRGPAEIGVAAGAFNQMQSRLRRYVEDRTAMMAAIAHDLRTPLARAQFRLNRLPDAAARQIESDLAQMEAMIAAVLAFVRDDAMQAERTRLDLRSLLETVVDDVAATGGQARISPGPEPVVTGDAAALTRLFSNLVDNAVKYGGGAEVEIEQTASEAVVRVVDEGPGIPPDAFDRVFEPFERLEGSRNRETGGIGLGLSVARSIARAHGGEVTLEPRAAGGLAAVVRLPCQAPP